MRKNGIFKQLMLVAVVPVLIFGLIITWFCYHRFEKTVYKEAHESMQEIANMITLAYDYTYPGDYSLVQSADGTYDLYKGETDITDNYTIVDNFSEATGTELSILYMDMRIHTTFMSSEGSRIAGICTNEATTKTVISEGKDAFYDNVKVTDKDYLVLYVPLKNSDDSIIGMVEVAQECDSLRRSVWNAVWPVLVLAVPGMLLAAFIAYRSTKEITKVLKAIQTFLNKVATGNLKAELDTKYLSRKDELGEISRSSVAMQKSIRSSIENDPLTGIGNRRYLFSAFSRTLSKAKETGMPFAVAMTDIDFFKKVNDTYGHNAGDEVLKAVAAQLKNAMMGNGYATRWGGEEFILVFDKCNAEAALPVLNTLLERIRSMVVDAEGAQIKITMTFGIVDGTSDDIDKIIEGADEKLYYGKQHGRNQIVFNLPE